MRVLIINKFLYPNGGSETYIFKLGEALEQHGHEVQYFGMEHEGCCVGNRVNAYTSDMDFHGGSKLSKLTYPIKTIYSKEARVQLRKVLDDFKPNVCHLNNFNYQLTPSIILEIVKWRKETGRDCKIIFTAHDYQLVCPNHAYRLETVIYILKDVRKKSYSLEKELEKNGNLSQEGIQMVAKQKECDKEYNQKMQTILGSEEIKNVLEKEISW